MYMHRSFMGYAVHFVSHDDWFMVMCVIDSFRFPSLPSEGVAVGLVGDQRNQDIRKR